MVGTGKFLEALGQQWQPQRPSHVVRPDLHAYAMAHTYTYYTHTHTIHYL